MSGWYDNTIGLCLATVNRVTSYQPPVTVITLTAVLPFQKPAVHLLIYFMQNKTLVLLYKTITEPLSMLGDMISFINTTFTLLNIEEITM